MDFFFNLLMLCIGLAFFLFGMQTMSSNLERLAGGKLEGTLKKMTSNAVVSCVLGAGITIAILMARYGYQVTIFEGKDEITAAHAKGAELDLAFATDGMAIPFHPGAAKFFAEKGITVDTGK